MKIVILDYKTLGDDLDLSPFDKLGEVTKYPYSSSDEAKIRIADAEVVVLNKTALTAEVLAQAKKLKLICKTATGYDNVDVDYCKAHGITLTNTPAYSTDSVAQVTVAMACSLLTKLDAYRNHVHSGEYFNSPSANKLSPFYHEFSSLTWGIVGFGNIGRQVSKVAVALGCKVLAYSRKQQKCEGVEHVSLNQLLTKSDIISIHCPLTQETQGLIGKAQIAQMKNTVTLINVARGAIWDEEAVADALLDNRIGAIGCDVFTQEPLTASHPFAKILKCDNALLTPHMAWGSVQSRQKCMNMVMDNIKAFFNGNPTNVVC